MTEETTPVENTEAVDDNTVTPKEIKNEELVRGELNVSPTTTDVREMDRDLVKDSVFIASVKQSVITTMLDVINNIAAADVEDKLSKEHITAVSVNIESQTKTTVDDAKADKINNGDFVNEISYEGTNLGVSTAKIKPKGRLKSSAGVAAFTTRLGVGKYVTVRLWHSGFSVIIAPPKDSDVIALHYAISNMEEDLATDTCNFIYSNYSVVINKLVTDFIFEHVVKCTLQLPDDKRYIDFCKVTDLESLAVGMAAAMSPKGSDITVTCKNTNVIKDDLPLCDFAASAKIDPTKLIWVNRDILDTTSMVHMSKSNPGAHKIDEVLKYQKALKVNAAFTHTIGEDDRSIDVELQTPTLARYFESGEYWVDGVIKATQDIVGGGDSDKVKERKIHAMTMASVLNKYNSYITKITMGDAYVDELEAISDILGSVSGDAPTTDGIIKLISDHINSNYAALVATYEFDCPKCKEAGRDASQAPELDIPGFKGFTPLNAIEHFLDLSTLRFTRIVTRKD